MEILWILDKDEYEKYKEKQHTYKNDYESGSGDYIGSVRTGALCFDILNWGNHLWFDLYVGGVDTGYGYSTREGYKGYPYDFCDSASFKWDNDVSSIKFEDFKKNLTEYIEKHIETVKEYVTDVKAIPVNLLNKANEELSLW